MASNSPRSSTANTAGGGQKKKECFVFEPQQWRRTVCKNCFRTSSEHHSAESSSSSSAGNGKGLSPRTSPLLGTKNQPNSNNSSNKESVLRKNETSPTNRRRPKSDEFKQKTPSPRESKRTLTGTSGRKSPSSSVSNRNSGSFSAQYRQSSTSSIDTKYVEELENDFFDLEDRYDELSKEKLDLEKELVEKEKTVDDLQQDVENYKGKIIHFERRVQHLEEEIRTYRERLKLPESDQANSEGLSGDRQMTQEQEEELIAENEQLRVRLEELEQLCQEVMEENDMLKEEQEEMQREIEEMHDHFQEDDTDTLRELKRDLETSNKNCRIFQFKLRKTERRYEQCENERAALEEKLNRLEAQLYNESDVNLIRGLEEELRVAKEVSVRLNSELELVEEKRSYFEEDNKHMKAELKDSDMRRKNLEKELSRCRQEIEKLKSMEPSGALQIPETTSSRRSKNLESISREPSFEEQSLQRDLDAAKERETDLNEQLKYSEDEIHKLKRRLNDAEEENDSITKRLESLMKTKNLEETDFEDAPLQSMRIQVDLLEQENSSLRKKYVSVERENLKLINDFRQLKNKDGSSNATLANVEACLDESYKNMEKKVMELQSDLERVEKENRRLTILNNMNASSTHGQARVSSAMAGKIVEKSDQLEGVGASGEQEMSTKFIEGAQLQELKTECIRLKEQVRQYDKNIKNIMKQIDIKGSDKKHMDIFKKYSELLSNCQDQEKKLLQMRRHADNVKDECHKYKELYEKNMKLVEKQKDKTKSTTKSDLQNASKSVLLEEIVCLEEEIDELASKCEKAESKINIVTETLNEKEKIIDEMLQDNERNEKELNQYIDHLLTKNALLSDLLNCVEIRANELQMQFDRTISDSFDSCSEATTNTTTENSSAAGTGGGVAGSTAQLINKNVLVSAGSDDVFNDPIGFQINVPGNLNDAEKIKFRLSCMEKLLSEERKRTRIAEKQAEMALKDSAHSRVSEDSQLKKKEIEMLKSDLDEKNEMLEEKEQQISDLKTRLDQTRKMNEALRTLLDKQDEVPTSHMKNKDPLSKEQLIEINSYKKEISNLKSDIHQYVIKINESEKIREKLAKEIRNLQAEVKVREEQIYEQDDEVRLKDQELRSLKKILEETQKNVKTGSAEEKDIELRQKNEKISNLEKGIAELQNSTQEYKNKMKGMELEIRQAENQQKILNDSIRTRDERIKEKDDLISHINQRLQNREKELNDFDSIIKQSNEKLLHTQEEMKDTATKLSQKELEFKSVKSKFDELQSSYNNVMGNLMNVKKENEKLKGRVSDLEKEKAKPPPVPRAVSSTGPSVDVDKLKSEISQLKKDKENLATLLIKDKSMRRDSNVSKNESAEAYTRAIQQQQYVTRVNLLTDNVTRLNRQNIELKLQNESIQNEMLEYQRRYKNIKEQYDAEQETWVAERITLESRMKEHEDRKSVIISLRKSLQDVSLKVADLEAQLSKEKQAAYVQVNELEQAKTELQKKLSQFEEQQKLPKVLQRFGGKVTSRTSSDSVMDKQKSELKVKLEAAEKSLAKLRQELIEKENRFSQEKIYLIKNAEDARFQLDGLVQNLTNQLADMEGFKEMVYLLRERLYTLDESFERDRKIWNEERMCLLYKIEDSRMMLESWLEKVRECENEDFKNSKDVIDQLEKEMGRYLQSKDSVPFAQIRRKENDMLMEHLLHSSRLHLTSSGDRISGPSVPESPGLRYIGSGSGSGPPHKALSFDWSSAGGYSTNMSMTQSQTSGGSSVAVGAVSAAGPTGSSQSLAIGPSSGGGGLHSYFMRSNRSMSPESSSLHLLPATRKLTNYPDPTPGFILRPSSRQSSRESVKEALDYSQRSFTLPGLRNNRSVGRTSPARQKFFEASENKMHTANLSNKNVNNSSNSSINKSSIATTINSNNNNTKDDVTSKSVGVERSKISTPTEQKPQPQLQASSAKDKKLSTNNTNATALKKSVKITPSTNEKSKPPQTADSSKTTSGPAEKPKADEKKETKTQPTLQKKEESKTQPTLQKKEENKPQPTLQKKEESQTFTKSKSKSTSIAPSIQQLRMKFAQKSANNSSSFDASSSKK